MHNSSMRQAVPSRPESSIKLPEEWLTLLKPIFASPFMMELKTFLKEENKKGYRICPPPDQWFTAFNTVLPDAVKVVIIGQDPYHGPGQAHGLSFSVQPGIAIPPSLKNIYKELESDLGVTPAAHGNLADWARQGVLLLNSVLTVRLHKPASHRQRGWERFTDRIIEILAEKSHIVYMLWGSYAKKKGSIIDRGNNLVLEAAHPSPLSVGGFSGCRHFSKANTYLTEKGRGGVDWRLPPYTDS